MVRLKVLVLKIRTYFSGISIPYGAIKSIAGIPDYVVFDKFQFLMVRLKAIFLT